MTSARTNERELHALEARARERVDQRDLDVGRDDLGLVLEAVPRTDLADHAPSALAITICWTSSVPSPMVRIFASRYMRHTGYSSM